MSRSALLVLGFAVAGAVGAFAGRFLAPAPAPSALPSSDLARLEHRIDEMEGRNDRFRSEVLRRLESTPLPAAADDAPATPTLGDPASAAVPALPIPADELAAQVKEVVSKETAAREEAMGRRFAAMAEQREKTMLDGLTERLGLSPYQRTEMEKILAKRREAIGGFFRAMFGSNPSGEAPDLTALREDAQKVQEEADAAAKRLLNQDQYDAWVEEDSRMRRGPFFGGSGPGDGR